jgi:ribosomal protein S18 acetylase RimI-like enzyme
MTPSIRVAVPGDEHRLAELNEFVQELHVAMRPESYKRPARAEIAAWFRGMLSNTAARVWLAEDGDSAVGYVLTVVQERPENPFCRSRRWCEIDQIVVVPGYRRRGVASALLQTALSAASAEGIADVELCAWSFNVEAQSLFRKFGFEPKFARWERKNENASQPM